MNKRYRDFVMRTNREVLIPLGKAIAAVEPRTLHFPDVEAGSLTWEEFRLTMEEATGIRIPDRVDCEVIEEKPLALPPPPKGRSATVPVVEIFPEAPAAREQMKKEDEKAHD